MGTGVNNAYTRADQAVGMRCWVNADVAYKERGAIYTALSTTSLPLTVSFRETCEPLTLPSLRAY